MTAIGAESKVSDFQKYQLAYSIIGDIGPNVRFKLVLRLNLDDQISEDGIVAFLDLIRDLHMGTLEESTLNNIVKHRPVGGTVVVTYDPETRSLISV